MMNTIKQAASAAEVSRAGTKMPSAVSIAA
jgi:hypothetical protein